MKSVEIPAPGGTKKTNDLLPLSCKFYFQSLFLVAV